MAKLKYRYNAKTLTYEPAKTSVRTKVFRVVSFLATASTIGVIAVFIAFRYFGSPREKQLERELSEMRVHYELMNTRLNQMAAVLEDMEQRDDNIYRTIFEAEPISDNVRKAGFGGVDRYKKLEAFKHGDMMTAINQRLDLLAKQMYIQSKSHDDVIRLAKSKDKMLASIPAIMPVSNKDLRHAPGGFGWRTHPIYKSPEFHPGMDFACPQGTEIYATGDGVVLSADDKSHGYGLRVCIKHEYGYETWYAHMSKFAVKEGQKVKRGQLIGFVGSTGLSTAPHVHYEVHKNGERMNPLNYYYNDLTPEEYQRLIEMAEQSSQSFD